MISNFRLDWEWREQAINNLAKRIGYYSNIHGTSTPLQIERMDSSLFPLCVYTNRSNRLDELCLSYTSHKPSLPSRW